MQNSTKTGGRPAPFVNVGTPKPVAESQLSVNFRVDLAYLPRCREWPLLRKRDARIRPESTDCVEEPLRLTRADGGCDGNQGGGIRALRLMWRRSAPNEG